MNSVKKRKEREKGKENTNQNPMGTLTGFLPLPSRRPPQRPFYGKENFSLCTLLCQYVGTTLQQYTHTVTLTSFIKDWYSLPSNYMFCLWYFDFFVSTFFVYDPTTTIRRRITRNLTVWEVYYFHKWQIRSTVIQKITIGFRRNTYWCLNQIFTPKKM